MKQQDTFDPYNTAESARWRRPRLTAAVVQYVGEPGGRVWAETAAGRHYALEPRLDLRKHSTARFEWGYGGSSPAQLAIGILADAVGDEEALAYYHHFRREIIASLPMGAPFRMDAAFVRAWVRRQQNVAAELREVQS